MRVGSANSLKSAARSNMVSASGIWSIAAASVACEWLASHSGSRFARVRAGARGLRASSAPGECGFSLTCGFPPERVAVRSSGAMPAGAVGASPGLRPTLTPVPPSRFGIPPGTPLRIGPSRTRPSSRARPAWPMCPAARSAGEPPARARAAYRVRCSSGT